MKWHADLNVAALFNEVSEQGLSPSELRPQLSVHLHVIPVCLFKVYLVISFIPRCNIILCLILCVRIVAVGIMKAL